MCNLLDNHLFIIFILFLGWSVAGVCRGSLWTSPQTEFVTGVHRPGVSVLGLPLYSTLKVQSCRILMPWSKNSQETPPFIWNLRYFGYTYNFMLTFYKSWKKIPDFSDGLMNLRELELWIISCSRNIRIPDQQKLLHVNSSGSCGQPVKIFFLIAPSPQNFPMTRGSIMAYNQENWPALRTTWPSRGKFFL